MDWLVVSTAALVASAFALLTVILGKNSNLKVIAAVALVIAQVVVAISWRAYDPAGTTWLAPTLAASF